MKKHIKNWVGMLLLLIGSVQAENWSNGTVEESSPMSASRSTDWWVNSGAYFNFKDGVGSTVLGELPEKNRWRLLYFKNNPKDTDQGYHPQNIARFVTRAKYQNFSQEMYFFIAKDNLSESENRNGSNGIFFFNRYHDGKNLYYTGIRVDGRPVIKKKISGTYHTLAFPPALYSGTYDRLQNPNLIPTGKWIGMKSVLENLPDGSVLIRFYLDLIGGNKWKLVAEAKDDGKTFGQAFPDEGHVGIRTDFMDVKFRDYRITPLKK